MSGLSVKAKQHIQHRMEYAGQGIKGAEMAHAPALGLDRSVCLRDVVELIRAEATTHTDDYWQGCRYAADFIEREFGS